MLMLRNIASAGEPTGPVIFCNKSAIRRHMRWNKNGGKLRCKLLVELQLPGSHYFEATIRTPPSLRCWISSTNRM
jgi:hypothetical protein